MVTVKGLDPAKNYDETEHKILEADFVLMETAVNTFKGTPKAVYIRIAKQKTPYYLSISKWKQLLVIWVDFVNKNHRNPNYIMVNGKTEIPVTPVKPVDTGW